MFAATIPLNLISNPFSQNETVAFGQEAGLLEQASRIAFYQFTSLCLTNETIEQKFQRLSDGWKRDQAFSSSTHALLADPSYLEIIAMGKGALPFIFNDLQKQGSQWFPALRIITGVNPIPKEKRGNIRAMTETWLAWAKQNGYVT